MHKLQSYAPVSTWAVAQAALPKPWQAVSHRVHRTTPSRGSIPSYGDRQVAKYTLLLSVFVLAGSNHLMAREIDEVVVTGSKIQKSITEITHSVTIVDEITIENQSFTDVTEILRKQAGVEFKQAGGVGQSNYLKLRGLGSGNVLVVIDGVKVNQASSGSTGNLLSQLDPATIESVEILRGPQATLYGANSTAGVIILNTKSGQRSQSKIRSEVGSNNWLKLSGSTRDALQFDNGELQYSLNASVTDSDNIHEHEYFEDRTLQGKLKYQAEGWSLGLNLFDVKNEFSAAELNEAYCCQTEDSHWAFQTPDPNNANTTTQAVYSINGEHALSRNLTQRLQLSYTENTSRNRDFDDGFLGTQLVTRRNQPPGYSIGDLIYVYDGNRGFSASPLDEGTLGNTSIDAYYEDDSTQVDYQLLLTGERFNLLGGVEYQEQSAQQSGSYGEASNDDSQVSYYTNGDMSLFSNALTLSLGMRLDDYASWGTEPTANVGLAWHVTNTTTLYGNIGTSFKPATMSQLFNPSYGDATLNPEEGRTGELGIRQLALNDQLSLELTYWDTHIDNIIFFDYSIPNPRDNTGFGQYNNGAEAESSGVEFSFAYYLNDSVSFDGNYTYTDSANRAVGGDWERTVQIADNKFNIALNYEIEQLYLSLNAYYSGARLRWAGDVEMPSYTRLDLSARYHIMHSLSASLRVENLLDEDIVEGLGYEELGRYATLGLSYQF